MNVLDNILFYQIDFESRRLKKIGFLDFIDMKGIVSVNLKPVRGALSIKQRETVAEDSVSEIFHVYSNEALDHYGKYRFTGERALHVLGNLDFNLAPKKSDNLLEFEYQVPLMTSYDIEGEEIFYCSTVHAGFYSDKDMKRVATLIGKGISSRCDLVKSSFVTFETPFDLARSYTGRMQERHVVAIDELRRIEGI